jgi:hypothetical protein
VIRGIPVARLAVDVDGADAGVRLFGGQTDAKALKAQVVEALDRAHVHGLTRTLDEALHFRPAYEDADQPEKLHCPLALGVSNTGLSCKAASKPILQPPGGLVSFNPLFGSLSRMSNQAVHDRVHCLPVQQEALPQHSFPHRTHALGDALTTLVGRRAQDLQTH